MKTIRYGFEFIILFIYLGICKALPIDWASGLGGFLGHTIGPRLGASRRAFKHIKASFPEKSDTECYELVLGMWNHLGRMTAEYTHLTKIAKTRVTLLDTDIFDKYASSDTPAIIMSAHLGNWELGVRSIHNHSGRKVHITYRPPNNIFVEKLLKHLRSAGGFFPSSAKSAQSARDIFKALKSNGLVGILIDQKYNEGIEAKFFGRGAMTSPFFIQIAQKFDCPIIPLYCRREKGANFTISFKEPIPHKDSNGKNMDISQSLMIAHAQLENAIKETPEQWLWLHRRWKS